MRALSSCLALLTCIVLVAADPLPCIVLNGRAWAPSDTMPAINAGAANTRTMHDREYVAVRAVAEALGGRIRWGGCPGGHCILCLPDREIPLRLCEGRSYWHVVDPGGIDWWHVGTRPAATSTYQRTSRMAARSPVVMPASPLRSAGATWSPPLIRPISGGEDIGRGTCPQGGGHVPGKTDRNGRLHCSKCGRFM